MTLYSVDSLTAKQCGCETPSNGGSGCHNFWMSDLGLSVGFGNSMGWAWYNRKLCHGGGHLLLTARLSDGSGFLGFVKKIGFCRNHGFYFPPSVHVTQVRSRSRILNVRSNMISNECPYPMPRLQGFSYLVDIALID